MNFTTFLDPIELAEIERSGTRREQQLAKHIRACWNRIASTELYVAELRTALQEAVELEAGPEDGPTKTADEEEAAIERFVQRVRALVATTTGKDTFLRWNRMLQAANLAARGKQSREYMSELAREALGMPAKDAAARGLAKLDIDRAADSARVIVEPLLFDERYFMSDDDDTPEPTEPPSEATPP